MDQFETILEFLLARARGNVPTGAAFIRNYIMNHPLYKQDSNISPDLTLALVCQLLKLNNEDVPGCSCEKLTESDSEASDSAETAMQSAKTFLNLDLDEKAETLM